MNALNKNPAMLPLPPRVRIFQSILVVAVFSLAPLWPAQAQAPCGCLAIQSQIASELADR
jgi:hypothetical protein